MSRSLLLTLSILAILASSCTLSQDNNFGDIYGIVTNDRAEPLRGAEVSLYDGPPPVDGLGSSNTGSLISQTVVYDDGHFEFNSLTPGKYGIRVKCTGYYDKGLTVTVMASRVVRMDFSLKHYPSGLISPL